MPRLSKARSPCTPLVWRALADVLVALAALWLCALALVHTLGLGVAFVVQAAGLFSLGVMGILAYLPHHLPQQSLGPANRITLFRLMLVALLAGFLGGQSSLIAWPAVGIALLVLLLDGVDGWLARRRHCASAFGARFDMETDALLTLLLSCLVWQLDKAGAWVLLSGLLRYLFAAAATLWPRLRYPLPPSRRRKAVCVLQVSSLLLALLPLVGSPISDAVAGTGLLLLCYSFTVDICWLLCRRRPSSKELNVEEQR